MEKRTEKNKALYVKVNKKIDEILSKRSNKDFEEATVALKKVDGAFFSDEEEKTNQNEVKTKTTNSNKKKYLIIGVILFAIIIIGIIVTVVKLRWKN